MGSPSDDRRRRRVFAPMVFAALASAAIVAFIGTGQKPFTREDVARMIDRVAPFAHATERLAPKPAPARAVAAAPASEPKVEPSPPSGGEAGGRRRGRQGLQVHQEFHREFQQDFQREVQREAGIQTGDAGEPQRQAGNARRARPQALPSEVDAKIAAGETDVALDLARAGKEDGTPASAAAWARAAFAAGHPSEPHQASVGVDERSSDKSAVEPRMFDARALRAAGRFDEARARLNEILKGHPDHPEAKGMLKDLDLMHAPKAGPVRHLAKKKPMKKPLG